MILDLLKQYYPLLIQGFIQTLFASLLGLVFSMIIGTVMGILQTVENKVIRFLANCYVEFFRNIPLLIIVMFFYVVVPLYWFDVSGFAAGVIGLSLYTSSFISDNVTAGIKSIDTGQFEAALSQGMSWTQMMWYVILPQAIKVIIPTLGNQFINLVKNSSTLAYVAGLDLMYYGDLIATETFITLDTYVLVGIFYLFITVPITYLMKYVESYLANLETV